MKKYIQGAVICLFLMPIVAVSVLALTNSFEHKDLPILGQLSHFSLQERKEDTVSLESLRGKAWIASFLFTNCGYQCPMMIEKLKKVQSALRFKEKFRLISITVDPERDTTEALRRYATRIDADPFKWLFLTGNYDEIQELAIKGFKLASGKEDNGNLIHSDRVVLVDGWGRIRGYYPITTDPEVKTLIKDAKRLIRDTF